MLGRTDKSQNPLVFVDAHAVTSPPSSAGPSRRSSNGTGNALGARLKDEGEMEAFQSMLQEYLDCVYPFSPLYSWIPKG